MKSKKFWIVVVVAGVMAIAAIVGIVIGVSTHKEPTMLVVCWGDGVVEGYGSPCNEEVLWPQTQIPIKVSINTGEGVYDPEMSTVLGQVISDTRTQLGFIVLTGSSLNDADVEIRAVAYEGAESERTRLSRNDEGQLRAQISVHAGLDTPTLFAVLQHELGHVIGLAHDDFESSVMFPVIPGDVRPDTLRRRFTDTDVAAIRARYNH